MPDHDPARRDLIAPTCPQVPTTPDISFRTYPLAAILRRMGELSIERDEVFRIKTARKPGTLAKALAVIGELGAQIGEIVTLTVGAEFNIREVTVIAPDDATVEKVSQALTELEGIEVLPGQIDKVFAQHEGGKIGVHSRATVRTDRKSVV